MSKVILGISGMTCSACSSGLEKYLNKQEGIFLATVNLVMANATIEYDEEVLSLEKIEQFVKNAGFKSTGLYTEKDIKKENKKKSFIFIIYTLLALLLMYVSMGHMINLPSIPYFDMMKNTNNHLILVTGITALFLIYGFDIIRSGFKNLIHKTPNMDTMVSIGVMSSFIYSMFNSYKIYLGDLNYLHMLYFESAAIVIYFVKLGRMIDSLSKDKTKDAIKELVKITPNTANLKLSINKTKTITIDEVKKGDILIAKPGDKIAVDGKIVLGRTHVDESFINGESSPKEKNIGDTVVAGSINYDGYIEYAAEKIGRDSTISEIVRLVIEATNTKAPIEKQADKISGVFVPVVIGISIITFIVYLLIGAGLESALIHFVNVLVVACPCSLGLATPLAIIVAEGLSAKNGILVKRGDILEIASKIDTVLFDKTGTLTYGKLKISKILNFSELDDKFLMQIVGSIEKKSEHPIAKAVVNYLEENNLEELDVQEFKNLSGLGLVGKINKKEYIVGNSKILDKYKIKNNYKDEEQSLAEDINTIIYVADNKNVLGIIGVKDIIRSNAKDVVSKLKENNIEVLMLTGDNELVANKVAKDLGIERVFANIMPKDKTEKVKELKKKNKKVLMCGDGINDSPSLALSDIGVSIHSATDIAMDSADVILSRDNLMDIVNLIEISKKTIRNIKQNLFWAFFYNMIMIPIACGILEFTGIKINPMMGSLAMVFSSLTVTLNALRLKRIKLIK